LDELQADRINLFPIEDVFILVNYFFEGFSFFIFKDISVEFSIRKTCYQSGNTFMLDAAKYFFLKYPGNSDLSQHTVFKLLQNEFIAIFTDQITYSVSAFANYLYDSMFANTIVW